MIAAPCERVMDMSRLRSKRLERFRNCRRGERLALACNDPSLNQTGFSPIRRESGMSLNKIFLGFKRLHSYPRYCVAINRRVIEQSVSEIKALSCVRFLKNPDADNPLPESALTHFICSRPEEHFHRDLRAGFFEDYTATFAALQIAFYMRFACVVIAGMDHRYQFMGVPNEPRRLEGADPNYFDHRYCSGHTWNHPDLANSERFYAMAREVFEADGRRITDCTVDGLVLSLKRLYCMRF